MAGRPRQNPPTAVLAAEPLDYGTLADNAQRTTVTTGGGRYGGQNNPFIPLVRASYEEDTENRGSGWREIMVTGAQVRDLVGALRAAAEYLAGEEIGIRFKFQYRNDSGDIVEQGNVRDVKNRKTDQVRLGVPEDDRNVAVKFTGRTRRGAEETVEEEDDDSGTGDDGDNGSDVESPPEE